MLACRKHRNGVAPLHVRRERSKPRLAIWPIFIRVLPPVTGGQDTPARTWAVAPMARQLAAIAKSRLLSYAEKFMSILLHLNCSDACHSSRLSTLHGEHDEVITEHYGIEWLDDRRSAERGRVGRSTSRAHHSRLIQLRCEGETVARLWRGGGLGSLKSRRQETYDIIEISLIIDAGDPGRIGGARMRERDGSDHQEHQQHGAQAIATRSVPAIENSHSRLVEGRSVIARAGSTMGLEESAVKTIHTA